MSYNISHDIQIPESRARMRAAAVSLLTRLETARVPDRRALPAMLVSHARRCKPGAVTSTDESDGGAALRQMRQVIERLVRDGTAVARSDGSVHTLFPVAVSAAEGEALRAWVRREGAAHTIEIGLGYGISALFVCQGLYENGDPTARHVVIDPYQATRFANCGLQFLEGAGLADLVDHCPEESQFALPRFLSEGRRFDLAFVDGNHRFDGVFLDLVYLGRLLRRRQTGDHSTSASKSAPRSAAPIRTAQHFAMHPQRRVDGYRRRDVQPCSLPRAGPNG
jgi:predicted O-methyltransferase YrrM